MGFGAFHLFVKPNWSSAQPKLQHGFWMAKIAQGFILETTHLEWPYRCKLCARSPVHSGPCFPQV